MDHGLAGDIVVLVIAGVVPVVNKCAEHGASLPPVVGSGEVAGDITGAVASVVLCEVLCSDRGGILDGF